MGLGRPTLSFNYSTRKPVGFIQSCLICPYKCDNKTLKNVNNKEWNIAICHVTLSLIQSEGSIHSSLSDLVRNLETSPTKKPFKEHSCRTALLKTEWWIFLKLHQVIPCRQFALLFISFGHVCTLNWSRRWTRFCRYGIVDKM